MAKRLRRQRRRIVIEDGGEARPAFCINRGADPFGDLGLPPYDAARNLTESGALPLLFSDLPISVFSDLPVSAVPGGMRCPSSLANEVTATTTQSVVTPIN
jgi:hypothetical protein